jgi:zinc transport system substrate-binding protein
MNNLLFKPRKRPGKVVESAVSLIALFSLLLLSACGSQNTFKPVEGKVNVVTSFYPLYYFAKEIGGDRANVVNLIAAGVEPHDWTPKSQDLDTVSKAQLFLYNGAGLEGWVDDFMNGFGSDSHVKSVEVSKGIPLIQGNPEANKDQSGGDLNLDPHTWVSPRSAIQMAANIRDAFIAVDPGNQADYESRFQEVDSRLKALDTRFSEQLSGYTRRDIVVSHQAFGYLCRDYGLNQVAVMGLSPESEPRAQDLLRISKFVKDNHIPYIFFEELVSDQLAKTLANEAQVKTLVLNPLEGLTPAEEKAGDDYFTIMERNLQNLQKALQ